MSLPTYDQLALPLMLLLSELDKPIKVSDAANILAERSKLSSEVLNQTLPSGKNIFKDRVAWSKTYLVKAGLINQPQRAYCEISELGKTIDLNGLDAILMNFYLNLIVLESLNLVVRMISVKKIRLSMKKKSYKY